MKIPALVTALALACGTAFAAQTNNTADSSRYNSTATASADTSSKGSGEGLLAKTKRAFHKMGDKMRSVGHKSGSDTRTMGASGSDNGRRARMDEAYANYAKKHPQQK
ncbi:MAG: hypothetical protein JWQ07_4258 [Ramlibacter sp.]|nr:hypothetical protein [Ramlibacter sp.]